MTEWFKDKVAMVTGAGSGIGRASALAFARKKARVVVSNISVDHGEETVALIRQEGGEAIFFKADVSNEAEVEALINNTIKTYGRLDFALNNAGIEGAPGVPITKITEKTWDRVMAVNLKGIWLSMKYEIPIMARQKCGAIVNTASTMSFIVAPNAALYAASKHGVAGLTKAAALECIKDGIRVNAIAPGPINTPFESRFSVGITGLQNADRSGLSAIGRNGQPSEVAGAVIWLCSQEASYCVGTILTVDGGQSII
jgi:NAD(P)-dependent dehydrogenase (short-subunit alcohol dehydrogenase family)